MKGGKSRCTFKDPENLTTTYISWRSYLSMYWSQIRDKTKKDFLKVDEFENQERGWHWIKEMVGLN